MAKTVIVYPPPEGLFDAQSLKGMGSRRCLAPANGWVPQVHGTPFDVHQDWALGCFLRHDRFLLFSDTGLGKTKSALDAIDYRFQTGCAKNALIVTSTPVATYEWVEQGEKYIRTEVHAVTGTPDERRAALNHFPTAPITATDYHTLQHTFCAKRPVRKKMKFMPDETALFQFGKQFDILVLDEIHRLKNPASLRFNMMEPLVQGINIRLGLTGTPFDRHPEDAWAQFWLIDGGETFQDRRAFLTYFFEEKASYWSPYVKEYSLRKDIKEDFKRRWRHRGLRITSKECKHLPSVLREYVYLPPSPGAGELMHEARQRIRAAAVREEMHSEFQYLRQLCSGLIRKDPLTVRLPSCTKIDWLLTQLEAIPTHEQLVVFYEFRESGRWLEEALKDAKHTCAWLYGGMKDVHAVLETWKKKKARVLLTQTQMAAESLNLQQAAYLVQYESPLTYRAEKQSLARVGERIGGRRSIVWTLLVRGSKEMRILELIREGKQISSDLLEDDGDDEGTILHRTRGHGDPSQGRFDFLNY